MIKQRTMNNNPDFNKYSRTGSIVTSIGALVMVLAFIIFLILNKHKSEKLTTVGIELDKKDSLNKALHDTIRVLKPLIEPLAYAILTNRISHPGVSYMPNVSPEYIYSLFLNVVDTLKNKILKVDYYLNDPTFKQKHYISENPLDSFKISYRGWGCLDNVSIFISKNDNTNDTLYFRMCDNLKLKGQSMAVH